MVGVGSVGKVSDLKKKLMGCLFDDSRWRLRLELLRLGGVGSLDLLFDVASVLCRYLDTSSDVKPGHVVKPLRLMAQMKVILDGMMQAA